MNRIWARVEWKSNLICQPFEPQAALLYYTTNRCSYAPAGHSVPFPARLSVAKVAACNGVVLNALLCGEDRAARLGYFDRLPHSPGAAAGPPS